MEVLGRVVEFFLSERVLGEKMEEVEREVRRSFRSYDKELRFYVVNDGEN